MEQRKGTTIYLPSNEQTAKMMENAWQEFLGQVREAGYNISEDSADGWIRDTFIGGYSYGWNDGYGVIRGQLEAMNLEHEAMQQ